MPHFSDMYHFFMTSNLLYFSGLNVSKKNKTSGCHGNRIRTNLIFSEYLNTLMRQEGQSTLPFRCPAHYESQARNPDHNTA